MALNLGANIMDRRGTRDDAASSSSAEGKMLCDGVYSLHEPEGKPEVEIIFIHGQSKQGISTPYEKAYWTTWLARDGSSDNCWPKTWLAEEVQWARILSVSYDVNRALKSSKSGTMGLYLVAETLVQEMVLPGVGIGQNGCPVVFVCHDVGGLIAKQIVVMAHDKLQTNKGVQKLSYNIKGFCFYATPHGGSKFVTMDSEIGRLNSRFEHIQREVFHNRWKFLVVAEAHATAYNWNLFGTIFGTMIVKEHSVRHVGYGNVIHVGADHFDVCRPESKRSSSFKFLTQFISEVVDVHKAEEERWKRQVEEVPIELLDITPIGIEKKVEKIKKHLEDYNIVGNLKYLKVLEICSSSLKYLPEEIGHLQELRRLNLSGCEQLLNIPSGVGKLSKLEYINLSLCYALQSMCDFEVGMDSLQELILFRTGRSASSLVELKGLANVRMLQTLFLDSLFRKCDLLGCLEMLSQLRRLTMRWCHKDLLQEAAKAFKSLELRRAAFIELNLDIFPETSLPYCPDLIHLQLKNTLKLQEWPDLFVNMPNLQVLHLDNNISGSFYNGWRELPMSFGYLEHLKKVELCGFGNLKEFPEWIKNLTQLENFGIFSFRNLLRLPMCLEHVCYVTIENCPSIKWEEPGQQALLHMPSLTVYDDRLRNVTSTLRR